MSGHEHCRASRESKGRGRKNQQRQRSRSGKKYDGEMFGITDGGQPIFCIEVSNESDLDEKEIAAAVQGERKAEQE